MKTRKFFEAILTALVLLVTSFVFVACGEDEAVKFAKIEGLATEVCVGENYDTSNAKVTIELESGKTIEVTANNLRFGNLDTSTVGNKVLTITYGEGEKAISYDHNVEVYEDVEVAIHSVNGVRTSVTVGEEYLTDDAVVLVRYRSGKTFNVTQGSTFSAVDTSVAGNVTVTVSYKTFTYQYTVRVHTQETIQSQRVVGTYQDQIFYGEQFDTSNIELELTYEGGATEVINNSYLTISELDYLDFNEQAFTVTYEIGSESYSAQGHVTIIKNYMIFGYDNPTFVDFYKRNSQRENTFTATGVSGDMGFEDLGNPYIVGNENEFIFEPKLSVMYANGTVGELENYKATYKVYLVQGQENELLSGNTLAGYVAIDRDKHTLKFTANAADKTFKIEVLPAFVDADEDIEQIEFTFKVINAYNVYSAADLSMFDNVNYDGKWSTYKQAHNLDANLNISGLVLQKDIRIMPSDIPAKNLYQENEVPANADNRENIIGSLKDYDTGYDGLGIVYARLISKQSKFVIEGNYFQIAGDEIPYIVDDDYSGDSYNTETMIVVNSALFGFFGEYYPNNTDVNLKDANEFAKYELNNIELNGNTKKSEGIGGGIIFMKKQNCEVKVYNNLSTRWYINYMSRKHYENDVYGEGYNIPLAFDKVNAFDAYNCLLYMSAGVATMTDCTFIGAGGPVMICDESYLGDNDEITVITNVEVDENTILESFVTGQEAWFVSFGASEYAGMLKSMIQHYTQMPGQADLQTQDYFATATQMNLVAVYKSGDTTGISGRAIKGCFDCENKFCGLDASRYLPYTFLDMATEMGMLDSATTAFIKANSPVIQTFDGSFGFVGQNGQWADEALSPLGIKFAINTYKDDIIAGFTAMLVAQGVPAAFAEVMASQYINALADANYADAQKYLALYLPVAMTGMNIVVGATGTKTVA